MEKEIAKQILDKWATCVIPKEAIFERQGQPQVNQEKIAHYGERGYKGDEVLWIAPKDCIRIEFEDTPSKNHRYLLELESAAKSLEIDYCITGHEGKSDYFNVFNIKGIPLGEDNKNAKLLLVDELLPAIAKDQLDRTNLGWTLSPIIGHPHWKPKYNGTIHGILRGKSPIKHKNKYPIKLLNKLKKAKKNYEKNKKKWKKHSGWVEDFLLNFCCQNALPAGSRHFIIEKNLAALIIFRKDKDEIKERYYKIQERKHDSMKTWERAILNNEFEEVSAGELAKYIKDHSLNYEVPPPETNFEEKKAMNGINKKELEEHQRYSSLLIDYDNKIIAEQIHNVDGNLYCVYDGNTKEIKFENWFVMDELTYFPIIGEEIEKNVVQLPSGIEEYGSDEELDNEIKEFIVKWLDVPEDFLQFAIWNIKRSWVFERFHTINYLRALGDTGQGKSRFLDVLGYLHYKPIATSGATTSAPVFRIIDKWRGTLIMDEADLHNSDEDNDIIKIINMGYERGKFVMRCDQNDAKKINFFDPFCPKVIATRRTFSDKAVEGRCITQVMTGTQRKDIPTNIDDVFWKETQTLRNKLLKWRFDNFFKIDPEKNIDLDIGDLEPRVKQIVTSLISLFGDDKKQLSNFKTFIKKYQEDLIDERQNSFDGMIVKAIYELMMSKEIHISASNIVTQGSFKDKEGNPTSPRTVSYHLKSLGFGKPEVKKIDGISKRCIPLDVVFHLPNLFARYGYAVTEVTQYTDSPFKNFEKRQKRDLLIKTNKRAKNEKKQKKIEGLRIVRNHRNIVTLKNKKKKDLKTQDVVVEENIEYDKKDQEIPSKTKDFLKFVKKNKSKLDVIDKFGEDFVIKMLQQGEIYENRYNQLEVLQ